MRAAIYIRVSTEEQAIAGISLDMQEVACRARAIELGATEIAVHRDEGLSGMSPTRPALQALLSALDETEILITWTKDRLSRDLQHLLAIVTALSEHGVRLVVLQEHVDTVSADGILSLHVTGAVAEFHARRTSENVNAALDAIAETGRRPSGACYGYTRDDGHMVIEPGQAAIVRSLFDAAEAGETMWGMAQDLNARGIIKYRGGRVWRPCDMKRILVNPIYTGMFSWRGELLRGAHEAIISHEQFEIVQARLRLRAKNHGRHLKHFSPLFRCGLCGGPSHTQIYRRTRADGSPYILATINCAYQRDDRGQHDYVCVTEPKAIAMVYRHTEIILGDGLLRDAVTRAEEEFHAQSPKDRGTEQRLEELTQERLVNLDAYKRGLLTPADFERANRPLIEEEGAVRARLSVVDEMVPALQALRALAKRSPKRLLAEIRERSVEEQTAFLSDVYERVEIHKGFLRFVHFGDLLDPTDRAIPAYYRPSQGKGVGF